jgi:hypothetical protein
MTTDRLAGVIQPLRRGGWSAKALLTSVRNSQLFETWLAPRFFDSEAASRQWLRDSAAAHGIDGKRLSLEVRR